MGYGKATAARSIVLFEKGQIYGACFQVRCVEDLRWCIPRTSIIVTAINFCAPNYGFEADGGGHCNFPKLTLLFVLEIVQTDAPMKLTAKSNRMASRFTFIYLSGQNQIFNS